jgi:hypothetical protein
MYFTDQSVMFRLCTGNNELCESLFMKKINSVPNLEMLVWSVTQDKYIMSPTRLNFMYGQTIYHPGKEFCCVIIKFAMISTSFHKNNIKQLVMLILFSFHNTFLLYLRNLSAILTKPLFRGIRHFCETAVL